MRRLPLDRRAVCRISVFLVFFIALTGCFAESNNISEADDIAAFIRSEQEHYMDLVGTDLEKLLQTELRSGTYSISTNTILNPDKTQVEQKDIERLVARVLRKENIPPLDADMSSIVKHISKDNPYLDTDYYINMLLSDNCLLYSSRLEIHLVEKTSGTAIKNALVTIFDGASNIYKMDESVDDLYTRQGVAPGIYPIHINASGYVSTNTVTPTLGNIGKIVSQIEVLAAETNLVSEHTIELIPVPSDLSFRLTDNASNMVYGAQVILNESLSSLTDTNGMCVFKALNPGTYSVRIAATGYDTNRQDVVKHSPENIKNMPVELTMKCLGTDIIVRAIDIGGLPVPNTRIGIGDVTVQTDVLGIARFKDVHLERNVPFYARKAGFVKTEDTIRLAPGMWRKELMTEIVMTRIQQFKPDLSFDLQDPPDLPPNNGDSKANAGETVNIPLMVQNVTDDDTPRWTLELESISPFVVFDGSTKFECEPLKAGETRQFLLPAKITGDQRKFEIAKIKVSILPGDDKLAQSTSELPLPVYPSMPLDLKLVMDPSFEDPTSDELSLRNNGNGKIDAGEHIFLKLVIGNQGVAAEDLSLSLRSAPKELLGKEYTPNDHLGSGTFNLSVNQIVSRIFEIDIPQDIDKPLLPLELTATSQGRSWKHTFGLMLEKRGDFLSLFYVDGEPTRGSINKYNLRLTYMGNSSDLRGHVIVRSPVTSIDIQPAKFMGRAFTPRQTAELSGIITIPSEYGDSSFPVTIEILNMSDNKTVLHRMEKDVDLTVKKKPTHNNIKPIMGKNGMLLSVKLSFEKVIIDGKPSWKENYSTNKKKLKYTYQVMCDRDGTLKIEHLSVPDEPGWRLKYMSTDTGSFGGVAVINAKGERLAEGDKVSKGERLTIEVQNQQWLVENDHGIITTHVYAASTCSSKVTIE